MTDRASRGRRAGRPRILFVHSRRASFIQIDRDLLAERWPVRDWYQPGRWANAVRVFAAVQRSDLVFGWFASWHTFWPMLFARLLRRPSVLVVGGFDTANVPEIGYGYQQGGVRKRLSRLVMRAAGRLVTNSFASQREIEANVRIPASRVTVVHHGVPDLFGELPDATGRRPLALTVGVVVRSNLERKGLRLFVETAALLPDVEFVLAGGWEDDAIEELRARAGANVTFTGWLDAEALRRLNGSAAVYVQASRHEGFGLSVAEAMLAGCIPVVSSAGALPEVVGSVGLVVDERSPDAFAAAVREALGRAADDRRLVRDRVLSHFPVEARRRALWSIVDDALAGG